MHQKCRHSVLLNTITLDRFVTQTACTAASLTEYIPRICAGPWNMPRTVCSTYYGRRTVDKRQPIYI